MYKQVTQLNEKAIAVEVPNDISFEGNGYNTIYTGRGEYEFHSLPYSELPPVKTGLKVSEYSIFGRPNEMTEEQWKGIVDTYPDDGCGGFAYVDYTSCVNGFETAKESGLDLLKSKGLNPESIIILIKQ